jgi:hypothetical protein
MQRLLASLLALWVAFVPAQAGRMALMGAGAGSAALPGPPTFTYQSTPGGTTGATSSFTISTGTASANRLVVNFVEVFSASGATISSVLIDGTISPLSITQIFNTAAGGQNVFLAAIVAAIPTGTSSTMVVTWSSAQSGTTRAPTWTTDITTLSSTTPTVATGTQAAGTTNTASIAVANSGSVLLVSDIGANGSKTFTASTPTITQRDSFNVTLVGDANSVASGTATANTSWTGSTSDIIGLALFR